MAKTFAPRVSKKRRQTIDLSDKLNRDLFSASDKKLLKDAVIDEIKLSEIIVKEQVRTKFNDSSITELAKNIKTNGLIQPLVVHRKGFKYKLICGERRYRAMALIKMEFAPCFVLDGKSEEELMAIQFSENSSREALNYIDKADGIYNYQMATKASERKIVDALGISKSEVHRSLIIAKLPQKVKEAAKMHNTEKYVLVEYEALNKSNFKSQIEKKICAGEITKRAQLRKALKTGSLIDLKKSPKKTSKISSTVSANAFLKALNSKTGSMNLDKKTRDLLKGLVNETKEIVDL